MNFISKHKNLLFVLSFWATIYFVYFHNLGTWGLLDTDESRYVNMSRIMLQTKDYLTLYLEGDFFFEKPPLYFWLLCCSFKLFNVVNEFTARIPTVLFAILPCVGVFFVGKKVVSKEFGLISALILATTFEYIVFAKTSMLDMILTPLIMLSTLCGLMTFYVKETTKKYFWWLFYIFSAWAVMSKGIPGAVIPFGTMFFAGIYNRKLKEYFRPQYFLVGLVVFFAIIIPWHLTMFKMHNPLFFNEYIMKHHLLRYVGSETEIGRIHGWYYYITTFLVGFLPWTLSFIFSCVDYIKKQGIKNLDRFYTINFIGFMFTMLFFSVARTKLVTYILPLYLFVALMTGFAWEKYIKEDKFKKAMELSVYITNGVFLFLGAVMIFAQYILPQEIYTEIKGAQLFVILLFIIVPFVGIVAQKKQKKIIVFATYIIFTMILSGFGMPKMMKTWYNFGQNDLMEFATYAKDNNKKLVVETIPERFSISYYYKAKPVYLLYSTSEMLNKYLEDEDVLLLIETKNLEKMKNGLRHKVIKTGKRYSLISK